MGRRTPTGNWNGKCCWPLFDQGGGTPPVPAPAFHAATMDPATGEMLPIAIGDGPMTVGRATDIWLDDYQGVYQQFGAGEVGLRGGRVTGPVGSRVVYGTDGSGDPLPEMPWIVSAPQATNTIPDSWNLTTSNWSAGAGVTRALDAVGLSGTANTATTLGDNSNTTTASIYTPIIPIASTTERIGSVFWVKKMVAGAIFPMVKLSTSGGTFFAIGYQVNPETGATVQVESTNALNPSVLVVDKGDWWKFIVSADGRNNTGLQANVKPAYGPWGSQDVTAMISGVVVGNVEVYVGFSDKALADMPPVFTAGAAVTRSADDYEAPDTNHDDTEGTYYGEWTINGDSPLLDGFLNYIGPNANLYDGTNSQSQAAAVGVRKLGFVYGSGTMRLNVDGVWHADGSYDGTLLQGALDFFRSATVTGAFRNVQRYAAKDESIIDGLMA